MKKILLILVVVLVAGFLGYRIYRQASARTAGAPGGSAVMGGGAAQAGRPGGRGPGQPVAVETAEVSRATVRDTAAFTGSLQPASRLIVAARTGGQLERLLVDIGDPVASGTLIAVFDARASSRQVEQARAALTVAEANLDDARIALEAARREHERVSTLREKKIASEAELDQAADALRKAEARYVVVQAQLRQQQTALETAREQVGDTRVTVSWEGGGQRVIGERFAEQGTLLRANDPIVSVLDVDRLVASVYVTEAAYARVRVGQQAAIGSDSLPGDSFAGRVVRIAPFLQESSRQAEVRIEVPNPGYRLKPGMFIRAELEFARRPDAVTVPSTALVRREERTGVFLVDPQARQARFVPVETGVTDGDRVEILAPPLSGRVVVLGQHLLSDGSAVLLPGEQAGEPEGRAGARPGGGAPGNVGRTAADGQRVRIQGSGR